MTSLVQTKVSELLRKESVDADFAAEIMSVMLPIAESAMQACERAVGVSVRDERDEAGMNAAREHRLTLRRVRLDAEKQRKRLKAESLIRGRIIDAVYNMIESQIAPVEARCEELEQYAERKAAAAREAMCQARRQLLIEVGEDPAKFVLDRLSEEEFQRILQGAVDRKREAQERAERERVEAERRAAEQAAERERLARENESLRMERAREAEARRIKEDADRAALAAAEADAKAARAALAKQEADQRAAAAEADRVRRREERARRAAERAPDVVKLRAYIAAIEAIDIPNFALQTARSAVLTERQRFLNAILDFAHRMEGGDA